jgi:hypothetical protein
MAGLAMAAVLSACAPAFEPELSEDFSRQAEQTARYFFKVSASGTSLRLQPDNNYAPGTVTITTTGYGIADDIALTGTDNGFNLWIDPSLPENNIPGLGLYPVSSGTEDGATPITANTAVPLRYIAVYTGRNTVDLRIPLTEKSSITNAKVALVLDPAVVSFNGRDNHRLNMDGNTEYGKPDDIFIKYYTVQGNTGVTPNIPDPDDEPAGYYTLPPYDTTTGNDLLLGVPSLTTPPATATESATVVGGTKIIIDGLRDLTPANTSAYHPGSSGGAAGGPKPGNFSKEIISNGYKFQRFNYGTKQWDTAEFTVSDIDTTTYTNGAFVVTFKEASNAYDIIRYSIDPYQIVEANPVLGYKHRLSYDSSLGFSAWNSTEWVSGEWYYVGSMVNHSDPADQYEEFTSADFTIDVEGIQGREYITVTIDESTISSREVGSLYFDTASLTANNVTVVRSYTGTTNDGREAVLPLENANLVSIGRNEFRIYLPSDLKLEANDVLTVYINAVKVNYKITGTPVKSFTGVILADPSAKNGAIELSYTIP